MTLLEIISNIGEFNESHTVHAKTPWKKESEAIVEQFSKDGGLPDKAKGYKFLLEIFLIKEFLEDWEEGKNKNKEEVCDRIIEYAVNDA